MHPEFEALKEYPRERRGSQKRNAMRHLYELSIFLTSEKLEKDVLSSKDKQLIIEGFRGWFLVVNMAIPESEEVFARSIPLKPRVINAFRKILTLYIDALNPVFQEILHSPLIHSKIVNFINSLSLDPINRLAFWAASDSPSYTLKQFKLYSYLKPYSVGQLALKLASYFESDETISKIILINKIGETLKEFMKLKEINIEAFDESFIQELMPSIIDFNLGKTLRTYFSEEIIRESIAFLTFPSYTVQEFFDDNRFNRLKPHSITQIAVKLSSICIMNLQETCLPEDVITIIKEFLVINKTKLDFLDKNTMQLFIDQLIHAEIDDRGRKLQEYLPSETSMAAEEFIGQAIMKLFPKKLSLGNAPKWLATFSTAEVNRVEEVSAVESLKLIF
jgi:hypothetical protein